MRFEPRRALYIGKFQPFHIGHMAIVEDIAASPDVDEIVIAVGSSQRDYQNRNPERPWLDNIFTATERINIILKSLATGVAKKIHVVPIFDFFPKWGVDSTRQWFEYIKNHCPEFHYVYTNREREIELFGKAGYEIRPCKLKYRISATLVREKMARGEAWHQLVCFEAIELVKRYSGEERAAVLFAKAGEELLDRQSDIVWEWRTFDVLNDYDSAKICSLPVFKMRRFQDNYFFSLAQTGVNFKIRRQKGEAAGSLKVKRILAGQNGIEAWRLGEMEFPIERRFLLDACKEIKFPIRQNFPDIIEEGDLILSFPEEHNPYVVYMPVRKNRFMYMFQKGETRCGIDVTYLFLGDQDFVSVGLEAETKEDLEVTLESFGLGKYKPMNYMQFLEKQLLKEAGNDIWKKL